MSTLDVTVTTGTYTIRVDLHALAVAGAARVDVPRALSMR